ncbi:MAG: hypothetical protein H6841_11315 [Planctomycetes bacterium]|nr:hypothetical protein [Planctomycetota bacterium]
MARLTLCLLACLSALCFVACGGGNAADHVNKEARYIPDVSTAEGATEAYARAIETGSITLAELVFMDEEREALQAEFRQNFQETQRAGVKWKLEFSEAQQVSDTHVQARVDYVQLKDGKEIAREKSWIVFTRVADGTWRYSRAMSVKLAMLNQPGQPANGNEPEPPGNAPAPPANEPAPAGNLPGGD